MLKDYYYTFKFHLSLFHGILLTKETEIQILLNK